MAWASGGAAAVLVDSRALIDLGMSYWMAVGNRVSQRASKRPVRVRPRSYTLVCCDRLDQNELNHSSGLEMNAAICALKYVPP